MPILSDHRYANLNKKNAAIYESLRRIQNYLDEMSKFDIGSDCRSIVSCHRNESEEKSKWPWRTSDGEKYQSDKASNKLEKKRDYHNFLHPIGEKS